MLDQLSSKQSVQHEQLPILQKITTYTSTGTLNFGATKAAGSVTGMYAVQATQKHIG